MHVFIVGEIGINHSGDLATACWLANMAKEAGCDFVKLQKRDPESCYTREELDRPCESPWGTTTRDKVLGRELSWEKIAEFDAHCRAIGIHWSASCFDARSLAELDERYPRRPFQKIASCMAVFPGFVRAVARQGIHTLVSCGLLDRQGVADVADVFEEEECSYTLCHCVAIYPCTPEKLNLRSIDQLKRFSEGRRYMTGVGYSGHETGVLPSVVAAYKGAGWIERHITLDRTSYGADQAASLEREGITRLVRDIRQLSRIEGDRALGPIGIEKVPITQYVDPEEEDTE